MLNTIVKVRQDFKVLVAVTNANPNGITDGNGEPRMDLDGFGILTDGCVKHWIRQALASMGENVLIQEGDDSFDGFRSVEERLKACEAYKKAKTEKEQEDAILGSFIDARLFGFLVPKANKNKDKSKDKNKDSKPDETAEESGGSGSITRKCAVSIGFSKSVSPINISTHGITKSTNMKESDKRESGRMGEKSCVDFGLYVIDGCVNPYQAEKNRVTKEDVEKLKTALKTLFDVNYSAARPMGNMDVIHIYWWDHEKSGNAVMPPVSFPAICRSVEIIKKGDPDEFPKSMNDYEIKVHKYRGITAAEDLISTIELEY